MINEYYVYFHYKKTTGELFHIGYGSKKRAYDTRGRNRYWKNVVNKHEYIARIEYRFNNRKKAAYTERKLITKYNPTTNIHLGGFGGDTWTKRSSYFKNKHIIKMRKMHKGKKHPQYGKNKTEKTKQKIKNSEYHKSKKTPVYCITTRKKMESLRAMARYYKIDKANLLRLLKSKTIKKLKGMRFKYVE